MKKLTLLICAVAVGGASCGSPAPEIDSTSVVEEVIGSATTAGSATTEAAPQADTSSATAAPSPSVPPGCRLVTELDEYGFEVEVVVCDEPPEAVAEDPDWLGSDTSRDAARLLRIAMIGHEQCGEFASYGELKTLVAAAPSEFREPLLAATAAFEQGSAFCNKDKDAWAASMTEAIGHLEDFLVAVEASDLADAPDAGEDR